MNAQREKLVEELINEVLKNNEVSDESVKIIDKIGLTISEDIAKAINPINFATAAIVVAYLEGYAKEIKAKYPECEDLAKSIGKCNRISFTTPVKKSRGGRRW